MPSAHVEQLLEQAHRLQPHESHRRAAAENSAEFRSPSQARTTAPKRSRRFGLHSRVAGSGTSRCGVKSCNQAGAYR
eukprot:6436-Heterococcus_DN1.PRE.10